MLSSFGLSCSRLNALRLCTRPLIYFFLSFSKIFILAYYRDLKGIFRSPRLVIVGHYRSFLVLVTTLFNKLFQSVDGFALWFYAVHHTEHTQESNGQNTGGREVLKSRGKGTRISRD